MKNREKVYNLAYDIVGIKEISGEIHNSKIVEMYRLVTGKIFGDETPWCAAFVGYCLIKCGLESTGKLNARSYLKYGMQISDSFEPRRILQFAQAGDIITLWRDSPESWKGHVGFYSGHDDEYVYVLGGNQNNEVSIKSYPIYRILDIRRY